MRVILGLTFLVSFASWNAAENRPDVPKHLVLNGGKWNVYQVQKVQDTDSWLGYADCKTHSIEVKSDETDWDKADTIVHEALHGFTCDEKGDVHNEKYDNDDPDEHPGIYYAAGRIADFIADNPQAVNYIRLARRKK